MNNKMLHFIYVSYRTPSTEETGKSEGIYESVNASAVKYKQLSRVESEDIAWIEFTESSIGCVKHLLCGRVQDIYVAFA